MPTERDLLLSILALDSYNQGYERNYQHEKIIIGKVVVTDRAEDVADRNANFSATAYSLNLGHTSETVIAYRGTDALFAYNDQWFWKGDAVNGYGLGAGSPYNDQAALAAEFFQEVTRTSNANPRTASVTPTGHSLGGGLAGFLSVRSRLRQNRP